MLLLQGARVNGLPLFLLVCLIMQLDMVDQDHAGDQQEMGGGHAANLQWPTHGGFRLPRAGISRGCKCACRELIKGHAGDQH